MKLARHVEERSLELLRGAQAGPRAVHERGVLRLDRARGGGSAGGALHPDVRPQPDRGVVGPHHGAVRGSPDHAADGPVRRATAIHFGPGPALRDQLPVLAIAAGTVQHYPRDRWLAGAGHPRRPNREVRRGRRRDAGTRRRLFMGCYRCRSRARSSAGERLLHTQEVLASHARGRRFKTCRAHPEGL